MPDTYMLSNIRNWRNCNANIPEGYELAAVVEAVIGGWDSFDSIEATLRDGLSEVDQDSVREIIDTYNLDVDPQEAAAEIEATCRRRVAESRRKKGCLVGEEAIEYIEAHRTTPKLHGHQAIEFARRATLRLNKYNDPVEDAVIGLSVEDAEEIAREDSGLIWVEVPPISAVRIYRSPNVSAYLLRLPNSSWAAYKAAWLDGHDDMAKMITCAILPAGANPETTLAAWSAGRPDRLDTLELPLWLLVAGATGPECHPWPQ